ncbi:unnamed protein product [Ambrosiozyma monospora]|uniref:Unnamed protein product n=1 Tax=Ambrosiozyma monospora TaxID=43982 RepID=A0A9W7DER9_AMBMO|nr:unnamed protein product [Ambrosiozyma monospora]
MGRLFDNTPRKKWHRFVNLNVTKWGTTFPVYTNLAVILFTYSIISPIILLFGAAGFFCLYVTYVHNTVYVDNKCPDTMGRHYPRALFQTMVGVYLGEGCLVALFLFSKSWGCVFLEAILLCFTAWFHMNLNDAFDHLMSVLPNTVMRPLDGQSETLSWAPSSATMSLNQNTVSNVSVSNYDYDEDDTSSPFKDPSLHDNASGVGTFKEKSTRYRPAARTALDILKGDFDDVEKQDLKSVPLLADGDDYSSSSKKANCVVQFFKPSSFLSFYTLRSYLPASYSELPQEDPEWLKHAYDYPDVSAKCPILWIPKDPIGLSTAEIEHLKGIIEVSDEGAYFDEKGHIVWAGSPPSLENDDPFAVDDLDSRKKFYIEDEDSVFASRTKTIT